MTPRFKKLNLGAHTVIHVRGAPASFEPQLAAVLWIACPKGPSTHYRCEFNRDSGWQVLRAAGFETVRTVAIDADWSALRFRWVEHIKAMSRRVAP